MYIQRNVCEGIPSLNIYLLFIVLKCLYFDCVNGLGGYRGDSNGTGARREALRSLCSGFQLIFRAEVESQRRDKVILWM